MVRVCRIYHSLLLSFILVRVGYFIFKYCAIWERYYNISYFLVKKERNYQDLDHLKTTDDDAYAAHSLGIFPFPLIAIFLTGF